MKRKLLLFLCSCFALKAYNQNPSSSICTWKNDATGCYSFIHDDFGDPTVIGINNYADTIARNRNLKFTFGAITSACQNNSGMWSDANNMIAYGHEIINHTHNHTCAVYQSWCTAGLWAEPATEDFATEMDQSTDLINTNTSHYPRFFIYPYDQYNSAANNHLKTLGYIGSRTGTYNSESASNFTSDQSGFYQTSFVVDVNSNGDPISLSNLNSYVDQAIANKSWINREMHNVGSSGWGSISVANYRAHLNYVKSKVNTNQIWVGTISEILTYQMQKTKYTPTTNYDSQNNEINITWNTPSFNVAQYLQPLQIKSPITLKINMDNLTGNYTVTQNGNPIAITKTVGNIIYIDVYPHNGAVKIKVQSCNTFCLGSELKDTTTFIGNTITFNSSFSSINAITYKWYHNNVLLSGETGSSLTLNNIQLSDTGSYKVVATSNNVSLESSAKLSVTSQSPYHGFAMQIPGTIEFEEYDLGGQNIAYYDDSNGSEGGAFRTDDVDVEPIIAGGYDIGWTTPGEWLEYTVNILETGPYTLSIRHASQASLGKVKIYIDGVAVTSNLSLTKTNSYDVYKTTNFTNLTLSTGSHVLRVEIIAGDVNLDKMTWSTPGTVGVAKLNNLNVQVFPNPFEENINIKLNDHTAQSIKLFNAEGKLIQDFENVSAQLSFGNDLKEGIYFVQIISEDKSELFKVIKK